MRNYRKTASTGYQITIRYKEQKLRLACDCGLVRDVDLNVRGREKVEVRLSTNARASAAKTREMTDVEALSHALNKAVVVAPAIGEDIRALTASVNKVLQKAVAPPARRYFEAVQNREAKFRIPARAA